jgi:pyruvate dehydrogenase complex dehydrogenase (E1) component
VIDGAYWLREPGPNADVVIAYQGVVASEAVAAAGRAAEGRRDVGVLGRHLRGPAQRRLAAAQRARTRGARAVSHVERLLAPLPRHCAIVTVIDGHPPRCPGSAPFTAIAPPASASSTSGRPGPWPTFTATSGSIAMACSR